MNINQRRASHMRTQFVAIDNRKCRACWKCIDACKKSVIRKINLPFHKHAHIKDAGACKGCLACVRACESDAMTALAGIQVQE